MMKMRSTLAWLLAAAATAMLALSCATPPRIPLRDNVPVKKATYGSPSDSVLVYGSASQVSFILNLLSSKGIDNLEMIQLNPSKKPMIITPARVDNYFFTEPLPVGSSVRFFFFSISQGRTTTFYERGIQGQGPTDRRLDKPGLYYMGSLLYCDQEYIEKKTVFGHSGYDTADLYPAGEGKEIDALKAILPKFAGTDWEPLITARIEELKK
jgi:hypothetical protein